MLSRKRVLAGVSAVALAAGTTLTGAGLASAQDDAEESTGSLSSSSIDFGETLGDLETAAEALNGPVAVAPNGEGGTTVSYTNETDGAQDCLGFTAPYQTVIDDDINTDYDPADTTAAIVLMQALEAGGDTGIFGGTADDELFAAVDPNPGAENNNDIVAHVAAFALSGNTENSIPVAEGAEVTWEVPAPDTSALAVVICLPAGGGERATYNGIDKQVVADQINSKIPGGSVAPVSAGSISGGSVEMGVSALGSLAGGDEEEPPVDEPAPTAE